MLSNISHTHCSLQIFVPMTCEVALLYYSIYWNMQIGYTPTRGLQRKNRLNFHKVVLKVAWSPSNDITLLQPPSLAVSDYSAVGDTYQHPCGEPVHFWFIPWLKVHAQLRILVYRKYQFHLTVNEGLKIKWGGWRLQKEHDALTIRKGKTGLTTERPVFMTKDIIWGLDCETCNSNPHRRWKKRYSTVKWFRKNVIFDINTKQTVSKYDTE